MLLTVVSIWVFLLVFAPLWLRSMSDSLPISLRAEEAELIGRIY